MTSETPPPPFQPGSQRSPRPLQALAGAKPPAPDWFTRALAAPHEDGSVDVDGARIAWRRWSKPGKPGLLFIHGGVAHKSWWDFIAPAFMDTHTVAAIDLSGMGDSEWRPEYRMDLYAREALAVAESAGLFQSSKKPVFVGHSFGGWVSLASGRDFGERLTAAIVLDSPIRPPEQQRRSTPPARPRRYYRTVTDGLARFHLLPDQENENLYILDHIARTGLMQAKDETGADMWTWKFDADLWNKLSYGPAHPSTFIPDIPCRVAVLRGEESALMTDDIWDYMHSIMPKDAPMVSIPDARHHLMLDQPIAVIAALRALFEGWGLREA